MSFAILTEISGYKGLEILMQDLNFFVVSCVDIGGAYMPQISSAANVAIVH